MRDGKEGRGNWRKGDSGTNCYCMCGMIVWSLNDGHYYWSESDIVIRFFIAT